MQPTDAAYKRIMQDPLHTFETRLVVGYKGALVTEEAERILFGGVGIDIGMSSADNGYTEETLMSVTTSNALFKEATPNIGGCVSAEINVQMLKPAATFRRMAEILPYVRACGETEKSGWIPKGVYYIDTREETHNIDGISVLTLHGYDSMLKAEAFYPEPPDQKIAWAAYEIGTDDTKGYSQAYTFNVDNYPHLMDHFDELVGVTLEYNVEAEGMQTGSHPVGYVEFYDGATLLAAATPGGTMTVPEGIEDATHIIVYGSANGAHIWNYSWYNQSDTVSALNMVETIVEALNSNIENDVGADDIRRLHLLEEDAYKLRHPDPSDRPGRGDDGYDTDNGYQFNYIASTFTCREVLGMIAAAYGGNWWIDDNNNLRLAVLMEYPEESDRLVDEVGYQLLIGGEYIRVS
jgi:hypothetical protein